MPPKEVKKKSARDRAALLEQINIPELTETLFDLSYRGNISNLAEILIAPTKNVENVRFEAIQQNNLLQVRNDQTRTCLDLAAMLGHHETVKLLAEKNATMMTNGINLANGMGYSSLHLACAWNQLESIKHIIAVGGDIEQKTIHGEKPIDIARRYHHNDLVDYLEWIAIRNKFTRIINDAKDFIVDPAKNMNKLNKDDKKKMEKYVTDALKWSEENQNMSNARELFTNKIKEAEDFLAPFYANATSETDLNNTNISNASRPQLGTPKSGRK
ncbi:unnamed protein product [Rotaria socialis]|uniref:Uncharacterized protein n=2 Tax=Rotaria socialis TaxID=392032 RepID=A0A817RC98_9BILA|nr:unnamed protein product [Rotaria socialis]CAF3463752.1 unnamed protein product [Rotaria socialis]CAF3551370.1 unnamed protein product [Rotaria socialis]